MLTYERQLSLTKQILEIIEKGDGVGSIELKEYTPNKLVIKVSLRRPDCCILEVWYGGNPDWIATIDGKKADIFRSNYVLRALEIPAGEHEIVMEFPLFQKSGCFDCHVQSFCYWLVSQSTRRIRKGLMLRNSLDKAHFHEKTSDNPFLCCPLHSNKASNW